MEYELINLNDYTRTGEGGTAVSYTHRAREEFLTARTVFDLGIPTPELMYKLFDAVVGNLEDLLKNI